MTKMRLHLRNQPTIRHLTATEATVKHRPAGPVSTTQQHSDTVFQGILGCVFLLLSLELAIQSVQFLVLAFGAPGCGRHSLNEGVNLCQEGCEGGSNTLGHQPCALLNQLERVRLGTRLLATGYQDPSLRNAISSVHHRQMMQPDGARGGRCTSCPN